MNLIIGNVRVSLRFGRSAIVAHKDMQQRGKQDVLIKGEYGRIILDVSGRTLFVDSQHHMFTKVENLPSAIVDELSLLAIGEAPDMHVGPPIRGESTIPGGEGGKRKRTRRRRIFKH